MSLCRQGNRNLFVRSAKPASSFALSEIQTCEVSATM
jgi:hypothetical protein